MRLTFTLAAAAMLSPVVPPALAADSVVIDPVRPVGPPACHGRRETRHSPTAPLRSSPKLGDMPPATHIKAVYRMIDGCPAPIVVARGVGNPQPGAKADDPALPARIMPAGR